MTIERRAQIIVGVLILTVLAMGLTLYWSSRELDAGMKRIDATSRAVHSAFMMRVLMDDYLHHGTPRRLREWERERDSLGHMLNDMNFEFIDRTLLSELRDNYRSVSVLAPQIIRLTSGENLPDRSHNAATKDMLVKLMLLSLEELVNTANDLSRVTQSLTLQRRYYVQQIIIAVGILGIAAIFINVYLTRKSVVQPLKSLSEEVEKIGGGDFASIPEIPSDDEVGNLSRAFNAMVQRLEIREIALKQARDEIASALEERSAALQRATEYNKLLQTIQSVQTQFISNARAEELFPVLLMDLLTLSESEFGFVGEILHSETGQSYLKDHAITDISWDEESRKVYEKFVRDKGLQFYNIRGLWGAAILSGEPVISNDPSNDPRGIGLPLGHPQLLSFLGLPFRSNGEVIGMAGIANRPGGYDHNFVEFLQPFVSTCANIIEAYRNENRRRQAEEAVQEAKEHLEIRVHERTEELELANRALQQEMAERRRAEEEVENERRRFYDILEVLPLYVMLLTPEYHIKFCNRFFRERFREPAGIRCFEHLLGRSEPCEGCETFMVLETMAPHQWEWNGPDGNIYDVHGFPFIDTDGSTLIMEVGIDITERKQAEDELKKTLSDLTRSNADLEQFAYVASHDLQEPLRNVAGCLQLLEKKYKNKLGSEADLYIRYAVEAAAHMRALIQDLLAYSRIGTRGKPPAPTDCEQIFIQVLKNLGSAISEAGAVITHDPLPTIWGDDTQLLQVFQNLIGNSVKFRRNEPPKIHVSVTKNPGEWVFSVKDNGMGIDTRYVDRIFAIFQRLNKRSEHEGTGIGLAIVKKVVERHHGKIWVDSEPGVGTTFYFTIPDKGKEKS